MEEEEEEKKIIYSAQPAAMTVAEWQEDVLVFNILYFSHSFIIHSALSFSDRIGSRWWKIKGGKIAQNDKRRTIIYGREILKRHHLRKKQIAKNKNNHVSCTFYNVCVSLSM